MANTADIDQILDMTCERATLEAVDTCVAHERTHVRLKLNVFLCREVAERLTQRGWERVQNYCRVRFGEDINSPYYLVPCLLQLARPHNAGVWLVPGELGRREPTLSFDNDGLLTGPRPYVEFKKEGVLTPQHYVLYSSLLPGTGLSGGFVDDLLRSLPEMNPSHFGIAVTDELVLVRSYYSELFTKAYIRGPRGLDLATLKNSAFPEDPAGVVTEHRPVGNNPLADLFHLSRLEVMWSQRDGIKTVQIEELVAVDNNRAVDGRGIMNRYIHSQWEPKTECFVHFDGAIRTYTREQYDRRLNTDLKKYDEKAAGYKKLFRVDGSISLSTWCRLVVKFFHENDLVLEYLGGPEATYTA